MNEPTKLMQVCAEAARKGGEVLRQALGRRRTIEFKGATDLVTDADKASEAAILGLLRARHPGAAFLCEESGATGDSEGRLRFIVDPLDGTTNYAHGLPHFASTVAAEDEHGLAGGATYDPMRDELFLAARGGGATLNGRPIAVSETSELLRALLCTGFPYDVRAHPELPLRLFAALTDRSQGIRRSGSAALDLAYVACGRLDAFWELTLKPWDMAAGILLVAEAGGRASDLVGGEEMMRRGDLCASGAALHPQLMRAIAEVRDGVRRETGAP